MSAPNRNNLAPIFPRQTFRRSAVERLIASLASLRIEANLYKTILLAAIERLPRTSESVRFREDVLNALLYWGNILRQQDQYAGGLRKLSAECAEKDARTMIPSKKTMENVIRGKFNELKQRAEEMESLGGGK